MADLTNYFHSIDLLKIEEFLDTGEQENLHLEFKSINDPNMNRIDRKNLSKCISGFANSDGGVIIWGITATKDQDGVDCANGKVVILNLELFLSRLQSLTGDVVTPVVNGVLHEKIPVETNIGYAKTLVPLSDSGPHMAKAGEDRYYKRSGDSFYKMEHYDIEDMFGRRKKPKLKLTTQIKAQSTGSVSNRETYEIRVLISIENIGRGSAKTPFLSIEVDEPYSVYRFGIDGNQSFGLPVVKGAIGAKSHSYGSSTNFVIHPNTKLDVTVVTTKLIYTRPFLESLKDLRIRYILAAEGISTQKGIHTVTVDELLKSIPE